MKVEKYVCRYCGSEDILEDAYARWDVETQQFELSSTHGNAVCENEDCEAQKRSETDVGQWIEVEVPSSPEIYHSEVNKDRTASEDLKQGE